MDLKQPEECGYCDGTGRLICLSCAEVGHGKGELRPIYGPPHSEEPCDWCADLLHNRNEP